MQRSQTYLVTYRPLELYDENYRKVMTLAPELHYLTQPVLFRNHRDLELELRVVERTRFTTTAAVRLRLKIESRWVTDPSLTLRLYHDARVAEVISYQNRSPHAPLYPCPNPAMYSRFEKRRVNEFLGRMLDFCLQRTTRFLRLHERHI